MKKALLALAVSASLASCTTTPDQQAQIAKVYDATCTAFPPLYAAYVNIVSVRPNSETKLVKAAAINAEITQLCKDRPSDLLSASVALSAAYARFVVMNAQLKS